MSAWTSEVVARSRVVVSGRIERDVPTVGPAEQLDRSRRIAGGPSRRRAGSGYSMSKPVGSSRRAPQRAACGRPPA